MSGLASLEVTRDGTAVIASLSGEVEQASRADVERRLRESVTTDDRLLVIDLSKVIFLDSGAVQMLFDLERDLRQRRQEITLVVPPGALVGRTLELTNAAGQLRIHPSVADALVTTP